MSASGLPSIGSGLRITIDTDAPADPAVFDDHAAPMLPGGYTYTCTIVATPSCVVVGATRDSDGQPVLLQWEPGRSLASVFDTMRTMSACGVAPTPTGMVACFGGMAVEATFPRGCSLLELVANRGGFLSPRVRRVHACVPTGNPNLVARAQALVSVSVRLARSLAQFHAKHIIFRDLNPNVIFVDDAGEEDASGVLVFANLCLAGDFASQPTGAASLAYVAPEEVSWRATQAATAVAATNSPSPHSVRVAWVHFWGRRPGAWTYYPTTVLTCTRWVRCCIMSPRGSHRMLRPPSQRWCTRSFPATHPWRTL